MYLPPRAGITVMPRRRARVDAIDLIRAEITDDGDRVMLTLVEANGGTVVLSLPACCLGDLIGTLPRQLRETEVDTVHKVHSWHLEACGRATELKLTLQTPDGRAAAFRVTPGQVAGMATLAAYGALSGTTAKAIN